MVEIQDLQEDYKEILASGELDKPPKEAKLSLWMKLTLWLAVFILTFWSVAWLY